ncbi:uncharacterized protein J3R85_018866 [Psidium guajava]|nr:uncharacterized protein J3R85_018866 [Psidium guajava]
MISPSAWSSLNPMSPRRPTLGMGVEVYYEGKRVKSKSQGPSQMGSSIVGGSGRNQH